jgi:pimeloyl-ACP methyl ester carboxylesterase
VTIQDVDWWRRGDRTALTIMGREHVVFFRVSERSGDKPWLTLLHGFPSSSWDWFKLWPALTRYYRVLALDLLGYGASEKPLHMPYSTALHADTVSALWVHLDITESGIVAHDIGTAITQELLARRDEGRLRVGLTGVLLMNGAVFIDNYAPNLLQRLLMNPLTGPLISRSMNERRFLRSLCRAFAADRIPSRDEQLIMWRAMSERSGHRSLHRLLHHIPERVAQRARWEEILITTDVPLQFVWGLRDPYVGHVAADVRRRLPNAPRMELADTGHFPQLEAPAAVTEMLGISP